MAGDPSFAGPLPVEACLDQLKQTLACQNSCVLIAPPGAGKTTAVPLALMEEPWLEGQKILVLEPRRIAARSAARFMASQLHEAAGQTVGYRVRMESRASANTRIELVTEGVFTRMLLDNPELSGIGAVIFDEFHERSLDGDLGLVLSKEVQNVFRPDLRLLPMSATLDGASISRYLDDAPIVESKGRSYAVEVLYDPMPPAENLESGVSKVVRSALQTHEGDMLVFLPGVREIERTAALLENRVPDNIVLHKLHGNIDPRKQDLAIKPSLPGARKIVLATSIAETSLTIDGVRIVIDSGLARVPRYEAATGLTRLETTRASLSSITQRTGRAGRTAAGVSIRLWQEGQNGSLPKSGKPEILESDLTGLVLDLASWGVHDLDSLSWPTSPPKPAYEEAVARLKALGAMNSQNSLTPKGVVLSKTGLHPSIANMLYEAQLFGDIKKAANLAVLVSERGLGGQSTDIALRYDQFTREKSARADKARKLAARLTDKFKRQPRAGEQILTIGGLLSLAYPDRIAKSRGASGQYHLSNGRGAVLSDEEIRLNKQLYLVIYDLAGKAGNMRILSAAPLEEAEIILLHGDNIKTVRKLIFDEATGKVRAIRQQKLGDLILSTASVAVEESDQTGQILSETIKKRGLGILSNWQNVRPLVDRLGFFAKHTDTNLPDLSQDALARGCEDWLGPFLGGVSSVHAIDKTMLRNALSLMIGHDILLEAERSVPKVFKTECGNEMKIDYTGDQPSVGVRPQELYGLNVHPKVCGIPIVFELQSPAQRPIQKTTDLPSFWRGSWSDVRSDMRGRYPKHFWPANPWEAEPTQRAKQRKSR